MRARWPVLLVLLGCAHANTTAPPAPGASEQKPASAAGAAPQGSPAQPSKPAPGAPPIAASPQGILRSRSVIEIQDSLRAKGFDVASSGRLDERTQKQLAAFQKAKGLAATGLPDRETLRRLGLDADAVYRNVDHP